MEMLAELGSVAVRSAIAVLALFIISRINGERQISQLTFYDYIVGIAIGSIAAIAVDTNVHLFKIFISMAIFGGFALLFSVLTSKSMVLRRLFDGKPIVMIYNGKIIKKSLDKHHYDINDLLLQCRIKGYFDISQIQCAVMETNGEMSILPKAEYHPLTANDVKMPIKQEHLQYNLIIDGKVLKNNLKAYGKDEKWLSSQIKSQGAGSIKDVLLCVGGDNDEIFVFMQNERLPHSDFFT